MSNGVDNPVVLALKAFIGGNAEVSSGFIQPGQRNGHHGIAVCLAGTPQCKQQLRAEGYNRIHEFSVLPSHEHPRWLFPVGNRDTMLRSLQIYAPLAVRGRVLKTSLGALISVGWKGRNPKFLVASREALPLEQLVKEVTGEECPIFSLSLGNLENLRALTIQVMRPTGEVLGYVKLPLNEAATDRVRNEAEVLTRIWARCPTLHPQIPRVLYSGAWNDGCVLFESSGPRLAGPRRFCKLHEIFLQRLWQVQPVRKPGRVLVDDASERWRKVAPRLGAEWRELGNACLQQSDQRLRDTTVACGVMHGDFVPWNTRQDGDRLFVFDWESARLQAPILWDVFHFTDQSTSLLHEKNVRYADLGLASPQDDGLYLLYSLHSVCDAVDGGRQVDAKIDLWKRRILRSMEGGGACPAV